MLFNVFLLFDKDHRGRTSAFISLIIILDFFGFLWLIEIKWDFWNWSQIQIHFKCYYSFLFWSEHEIFCQDFYKKNYKYHNNDNIVDHSKNARPIKKPTSIFDVEQVQARGDIIFFL